jgi:hypothetical protein
MVPWARWSFQLGCRLLTGTCMGRIQADQIAWGKQYPWIGRRCNPWALLQLTCSSARHHLTVSDTTGEEGRVKGWNSGDFANGFGREGRGAPDANSSGASQSSVTTMSSLNGNMVVVCWNVPHDTPSSLHTAWSLMFQLWSPSTATLFPRLPTLFFAGRPPPGPLSSRRAQPPLYQGTSHRPPRPLPVLRAGQHHKQQAQMVGGCQAGEVSDGRSKCQEGMVAVG